MTLQQSSLTSEAAEGLTPVVDRNIRDLLARRLRKEQQRTWEQRIADGIARFTGSMKFVYLHLLIFGTWILINAGWLPFSPFDPSFVILAMVASVEAIFLSTFVLMNQSRMATIADRQANLNLQISLLTEHEITRILTLLKAVAARSNVSEAESPELLDLSRDVVPETVMDKIEEHERSVTRPKSAE